MTSKRVKAWAVVSEDDGQFMYDIHGQALIYHENRHPDQSVFSHTDDGERVVPVTIIVEES
jgi:hypothetical protein